MTRFDGQPYRLGDKELLASNGRVHSEMKEVAAGVAERACVQDSRFSNWIIMDYNRSTRLRAGHFCFAHALVNRCIDGRSHQC